MPEKVTLALYDITSGMAKNMSMMFLGKQVDAIYHSSLIVFGREYYFGGGICHDAPDSTPYGKAIEKVNMGETELPKEIFTEFLDEISSRYTQESYNLIEHNCNHFTDEACEFLVGKGIPKRVVDQGK